jgi:hypothetical protein
MRKSRKQIRKRIHAMPYGLNFRCRDKIGATRIRTRHVPRPRDPFGLRAVQPRTAVAPTDKVHVCAIFRPRTTSIRRDSPCP